MQCSLIRNFPNSNFVVFGNNQFRMSMVCNTAPNRQFSIVFWSVTVFFVVTEWLVTLHRKRSFALTMFLVNENFLSKCEKKTIWFYRSFPPGNLGKMEVHIVLKDCNVADLGNVWQWKEFGTLFPLRIMEKPPT